MLKNNCRCTTVLAERRHATSLLGPGVYLLSLRQENVQLTRRTETRFHADGRGWAMGVDAKIVGATGKSADHARMRTRIFAD
jgi:hypothetical protein